MDYAPVDVYDYKIAREYNWNVKNKASKGYEQSCSHTHHLAHNPSLPACGRNPEETKTGPGGGDGLCA
ncbi:hypothetical protein, partial [Acinetobacter baumannii]|uniref:hypothetical protein n=1 Tax=Acinetobacter baumannii TaxID=470 RepID=UPI0031F356C3